jgi:hypothetical protein
MAGDGGTTALTARSAWRVRSTSAITVLNAGSFTVFTGEWITVISA